MATHEAANAGARAQHHAAAQQEKERQDGQRRDARAVLRMHADTRRREQLQHERVRPETHRCSACPSLSLSHAVVAY
jgi:hypothetical protein